MYGLAHLLFSTRFRTSIVFYHTSQQLSLVAALPTTTSPCSPSTRTSDPGSRPLISLVGIWGEFFFLLTLRKRVVPHQDPSFSSELPEFSPSHPVWTPLFIDNIVEPNRWVSSAADQHLPTWKSDEMNQVTKQDKFGSMIGSTTGPAFASPKFSLSDTCLFPMHRVDLDDPIEGTGSENHSASQKVT